MDAFREATVYGWKMRLRRWERKYNGPPPLYARTRDRANQDREADEYYIKAKYTKYSSEILRDYLALFHIEEVSALITLMCFKVIPRDGLTVLLEQYPLPIRIALKLTRNHRYWIWSTQRMPLPKTVKRAIHKSFEEYVSKPNFNPKIKIQDMRLKDMLFILRLKPTTPELEAAYKQVANA